MVKMYMQQIWDIKCRKTDNCKLLKAVFILYLRIKVSISWVLLSVADEILIISKSNVVIFLLEDLALLLYTLLILKVHNISI